MNTFVILGSVIGLWITLTLPYKVYPVKLSKMLDLDYGWKRIKHAIALLLIMVLALAAGASLSIDLGYLQKGEKIGFDNLRAMSVFICVWMILLMVYYALFVRGILQSQYVKLREIDKSLVDRAKKSINLRLVFILIVFIISSVGEGFFQDLLYEPYIKPLFCNYLSLLCQ